GTEHRDLLALGETLGLFLLELVNHSHRHLLPGLTRPLPVDWRDAPPRGLAAAPASSLPVGPAAIWPPRRGGRKAGPPGCPGPRTDAAGCPVDARGGRPRSSPRSSSRPRPARRAAAAP